jgi:hypothetical protein
LEQLENMLFGSGEEALEEDPDKVLTRFDSLAIGTSDHVLQAHTSLTMFLKLWARELEKESLATSVMACDFVANESNETVVQSSSMKLMFRPPKRYLSHNEQKNLEKGVLPDRKGAKLDAWSPGGVEVLVRSVVMEDDVQEVWLMAKRCGIDGDTIIKVSSERVIVRRLKEAIRIWRKVRDM